ncbi:DoxX family protein [Maricaulis sp. MIT060901]|uniref:DoxX family protein n=1 Tax=Maricaulis sp. MIT060901 TaxID=3096993 RepID=UPI00399A4650
MNKVSVVSTQISNKPDRFMPDWVLGLIVRLSIVPGLWSWGRANAGEDWREVSPGILSAVGYWNIPLLPDALVAQIAVWGAHLAAITLLLGFLSRVVGFVLVLAGAAYIFWIAPDAWQSAVVFEAIAFYLFARGSGALSIDGALAATTR